MISRHRVEAPPNGAALPPDWPRGHIAPSPAGAPAVEDASLRSDARPPGAAGSGHAGASPKREDVPLTARAFQHFDDVLEIRWDDDFVYVEGNSLPDHEMMTGITAWNQQVPLPQDFTGENAWRITRHPRPAAESVYGHGEPFQGRDRGGDQRRADLQSHQAGRPHGHEPCGRAGRVRRTRGRADDYHYHLPPTFLNERLGDELPIGFGMDGYPLYGFTSRTALRRKALTT